MLIIVVALVAVFVVVAPAQARHDRSGIEKARVAGIRIGRGAGHIMARAPRGSCANDPTRFTCPPIRAVRVARTHKRLARAAQIDQCAVRLGATPESPYKAAGMAQADGHNQCYASVTWHQLFTSLFKFKTSNEKWTQMAVKSAGPSPGGTTIHASARYDCESGALRAWHPRAEGYAMLEGTLYIAVQNRYNNLNCS
jgi:hypothetical protein